MKHIGRMKNNRRKLVVAYRVIPGDPDNCLVVHTESLNADYHDAMIKVLESNAGQNAYEFAEAMHRSHVPDGRNMLATFHREGKLTKVPTKLVEMLPNTQTSIALDELNTLIAQQKGVTVADLALGANQVKKKPEDTSQPKSAAETVGDYSASEPGSVKSEIKIGPGPEVHGLEVVEDAVTIDEQPLSDTDLARSYRSQADAMFKEAKRLRDLAKELSAEETD